MFILYDNIKMLCEQRGVKVSNMLEEIGMSKSTLSNLKNGRSETITPATARKIAAYLSVSVDDVMHGIKKQPTIDMDDELKECLEVLRDRPDTRALLHASRDMTPEQVAKMAEFMQSMKGDSNAD